MNQELLERLKVITEEEQSILDGNLQVEQNLYSTALSENFIIESQKLLKKGCLIEARPHTRFVHFPKHSHNFVELVYMMHGTTTHIINETQKIVLKEGDLLFLNQHATQEIMKAGYDDIAVNFIILPDFFKRGLTMIEQENVLRDFLIRTLSGQDSKIPFLHFSAKEILPVQNLLENMIWTLFTDKTHTNTINQTTMGLLFMNLSMFVDNISRNIPELYEENLIFSVLNYIEMNYKNGTLSEIAGQLNLPTYYISRLLKKYTNQNFKQLLQERKLQQASYLILNTPQTVEAVMEQIGYDNSSFFYRIFRNKYGCSPKEYRRR